MILYFPTTTYIFPFPVDDDDSDATTYYNVNIGYIRYVFPNKIWLWKIVPNTNFSWRKNTYNIS